MHARKFHDLEKNQLFLQIGNLVALLRRCKGNGAARGPKLADAIPRWAFFFPSVHRRAIPQFQNCSELFGPRRASL
jgi:hypothetical protein